MRTKLITWDWREQPDLADIAAAAKDLSQGKLHLYEVDTGSDQFAIVLSDTELTHEQVDYIYGERWGE